MNRGLRSTATICSEMAPRAPATRWPHACDAKEAAIFNMAAEAMLNSGGTL